MKGCAYFEPDHGPHLLKGLDVAQACFIFACSQMESDMR